VGPTSATAAIEARRSWKRSELSGRARRHDPHHGHRLCADTILCRGWRNSAEDPDINVEIAIDMATDIVASAMTPGFETASRCPRNDRGGIRPGQEHGRWWGHPLTCERPTPRKQAGHTENKCLNLSLTTYGGLYAWESTRQTRDESAGRRPARLNRGGRSGCSSGGGRNSVCLRPGGNWSSPTWARGRLHASARGLVSSVPGLNLYYQDAPELAALPACRCGATGMTGFTSS